MKCGCGEKFTYKFEHQFGFHQGEKLLVTHLRICRGCGKAERQNNANGIWERVEKMNYAYQPK